MQAAVTTLGVSLALVTAAYGSVANYKWTSTIHNGETWNKEGISEPEMPYQFLENGRGDSDNMTLPKSISQESPDIKNILRIMEHNNKKRMKNIGSMLLQKLSKDKTKDYLSQTANSLPTTTDENAYSESGGAILSKSGILAILMPFHLKEELKVKLTNGHDEKVPRISTKTDCEWKEDIDLRETTQYDCLRRKPKTGSDVIESVTGGIRPATHHFFEGMSAIPTGFEMQNIHRGSNTPGRGKRSIKDPTTRNLSSEQHRSGPEEQEKSSVKHKETYTDKTSIGNSAASLEKVPAARVSSIYEKSSAAASENIRKCGSKDCKPSNERVSEPGNRSPEMKTRDAFDEDWAYIPDESENSWNDWAYIQDEIDKASKDEISLTISGKLRQVSGKPIKLQYNLAVNPSENNVTGTDSGGKQGEQQHSEPDDEKQVSELSDPSVETGSSEWVDPLVTDTDDADYHDPQMEDEHSDDSEPVDPLTTGTHNMDYHYPQMENEHSSASGEVDPPTTDPDYHEPQMENEHSGDSEQMDPLRTGSYNPYYQYPLTENDHSDGSGQVNPFVTGTYDPDYHYPQMENVHSGSPGRVDPLRKCPHDLDYLHPHIQYEPTGDSEGVYHLRTSPYTSNYHYSHIGNEHSGGSGRVYPLRTGTNGLFYRYPHMKNKHSSVSGQIEPLRTGIHVLDYLYPQKAELLSYPKPVNTLTEHLQQMPVTNVGADVELYNFDPYYKIKSVGLESSAQSLTLPQITNDPGAFGIWRLLAASLMR